MLSEKRKVVFYLNCLGKGGAEKVVSLLASSMSADNWDVTIAMLYKDRDEYPTDERVNKVYLGIQDESVGRIKVLQSRIKALRRMIQSEKPDVLISFMKSAIYRSLFATFGMKVPMIVSVRNDPNTDFVGLKNRIFTSYMSRKVMGCVFQTEDAKHFFSQKLQRKSCVIPNPVSKKYIGIEQSVEKRKIIASVGRLVPQKNHLLLINAFAAIRERYPDYVLRIYGAPDGGTYYDGLKQCIMEHNLEQKVFFMGTSNSLETELKDISMFVLSSDYEGLPNSLIEAMVMGIPVISTDCPCGGPKTLIRNGKNGLLIPVGDKDKLVEAMTYYLEHPEEAHAMGMKGQEILNQVAPEKVTEAWENYINQVLQKKQRKCS